jgi:hypothetical protein
MAKINSIETRNRIKKLEQEIYRLRQIEKLEEFKEHMDYCYDTMLGDNATKESSTAFYNSDFIIKFRCKEVALENSAEVFNDIQLLIDEQIEELNSFSNI